VVVSVEAPRLFPEAVLALPELAAVDEALLWAPPFGPQICGAGAVHVVVAHGARRFTSVREQAERLLHRVRPLAAPGQEPPPPRLIGGFAFRPGGADGEPWQSFGDARFVLPRFAYSNTGDRAWMSLALSPDEHRSAAEQARWLERFEKLGAALLALAAQGAPEPVVLPSAVGALEQRPESEFRERVDAIRAAIEVGSVDKVVAARRATLNLAYEPDLSALLVALRAQAPECTRFAFRNGTASFVGATPERLVSRRGSIVETEALAGSIRADGAESAARLLESDKDRAEHEIVVRQIVRCLQPLVVQLSVPEQPEVRRLRHVFHLRTPLSASLNRPRHVLELVERLHPTPAVAGVPTEAALCWIAKHEPDQRGWYAGPVGWLDATGNGDFCVALRSGLLDGRALHVYAGCGIVRGSEAADEYAETRPKLAALLGAFGVDP
jgi:menaquinone-specific isochorismate synthase